jgi:hypothetical protein
MVVGSKGDDGKTWASVLSGEKGFVLVEDETTLSFNLSFLTSNKDDIFWKNIFVFPSVGMLFIDLITRIRYRVNGTIIKDGNRFLLTVKQAYPNCPKYIQRREVIQAFPKLQQNPPMELKQWMEKCDTFFVASSNAAGDLDVSHRGGMAGFVELVSDVKLKIPDYAGNSMFNTLGNFVQFPQAGLLFVDFESGKTLQISGRPEITWKEADQENKTGGTGRFWYFHLEDMLLRTSLPNLSFRFIDYSPFNPK